MTNEVKNEMTSLVENSHNAFVSSVDENGFPNTKVMFALYHDGLKTHCFSTNLSSKRASQFMVNPKACIYYCDEKEFKGLMLIGTIKVCTDAYHKELLWREGYERYYPKGVTDEDYCVYEFTAHTGNYYHGFENFTFVMEEFNVNT